MAAKMGSFRYSLAEKRERLLSSTRDLSQYNFGEVDRPSCLSGCIEMVKLVAHNGYEMGKKDPRKVVFAAKIGLALVLLSLLVFLQPVKSLAQHCVWALLTVVVVFEFSIGATLSKGLNRGIGTMGAGALALGMAELCQLAGKWEEAVIVISIFFIGFISSYAKLHSTMKPYEYGFRVFLLTYCLVMISGYRSREFVPTIVNRFLLIGVGAAVGLAINILIYPIWAGEDLHNLVVKNFTNVANSLEGCVKEYLNCVEYDRIPSKILTFQASDEPIYKGYRSAMESISQEEALLGFAIWEPPHGPYQAFKYPWRSYVKVSGALRHCAFMVMALHGCILSEIQAPAERRQVFRKELQRVGTEGAKVLNVLGSKVKRMEKLDPGDLLFAVHVAAEELQSKVDKKSYILINSENWEFGREKGQPLEHLDGDDEEGRYSTLRSASGATLCYSKTITAPKSMNDIFMKQTWWPSRPSFNVDAVPQLEESQTYESASALSLATFTSLLIEFVARLQNLVDSFVDLSEKANFREPAELAEEGSQHR